MERDGDELYFSPEERRLLPGPIPTHIKIGHASLLSERLEKEANILHSAALKASGLDPEYCRGKLADLPRAYRMYELGRLIEEAMFE